MCLDIDLESCFSKLSLSSSEQSKSTVRMQEGRHAQPDIKNRVEVLEKISKAKHISMVLAWTMSQKDIFPSTIIYLTL